MSKQQTDKRIAALERKLAAQEKKIAELEGTPAPPPAPASTSKPMSDAEWRDKMHQAAEARANSFRFSPSVLRDMERACGTADLRDLVHASHAPQGPSAGGIPSSQQLTGVHPGGGARVAPGDGRGWKPQRDFGADGQHPTPGVAAADRIADAFAAQDRAELAERLKR